MDRSVWRLDLRYVNSRTHVKIELEGLTEQERKFYRRALDKFKRNLDWLSFEEFAFDPRSPIFSQRRSHLDVMKDPLYLALEDMSLQLGVQQGMIARQATVSPRLTNRSVAESGAKRPRRQPQALRLGASKSS